MVSEKWQVTQNNEVLVREDETGRREAPAAIPKRGGLGGVVIECHPRSVSTTSSPGGGSGHVDATIVLEVEEIEPLIALLQCVRERMYLTGLLPKEVAREEGTLGRVHQ